MTSVFLFCVFCAFLRLSPSDGINFLAWTAAGNKPNTQYEIWCAEGAAGAWRLLYTSSRVRHPHQGVTPGVQYAYKVRAKRGDRFSGFSAVAVVYPASGVPLMTLQKAA